MFAFNNMTLLYIEGDIETRENYTTLLRSNGMKVLETDNTVSARELFLKNKVDFILIDLNLHAQNRMDFIRFLRENEVMVPIIITANDSNKEVLLEAINLDTSHYLIKPFETLELLDALKYAAKKIMNTNTFSVTDSNHGFSYDPANKLVNKPDGTIVPLTRKEYLLFELLLKNKHSFVSYSIIEAYIWEDEVMSIDALRTLVRSLRKKTYSGLITNHSNLGYKLEF